MRAVNFPAGLSACCSLTGGIAFEDYGAMEKVTTEREMKMFAAVGFES